jgi:hypothetical protein
MDDDLTMMIGPSVSGTLLEVGVLGYGGDDPVIIHAMRVRPTFFGSCNEECASAT